MSYSEREIALAKEVVALRRALLLLWAKINDPITSDLILEIIEDSDSRLSKLRE